MASTLTPICALEGHTDRVWHAAVHPTRDVIATASGDKSVRLWAPRRPTPAPAASHGSAGANASGGSGDAASPVSWACIGVLEDFTTRTVRCFERSPDGRFLAVASFDGMATVWALDGGGGGGDLELVATLEGHENEVKGVAWSASGDLLATCSRDKSVWLWAYDERDAEFECAAVLHGHAQDVKAVAWHPSRELLFSASYDDSVKAWGESPDEADWVCTDTLSAHSSTVWGLALAPTGDGLATVSDDCSVVVWAGTPMAAVGEVGGAGAAHHVLDAMSWRKQATLRGFHTRSVYSVAWSRPLPPAHGVATPGAETEGAAEGGEGGRTFLATCGADDSIRVFTRYPRTAAAATAAAPAPSPTDGDAGAAGDASSASGPSGPAGWAQVGMLAKPHGFDVNCVRWHPRDPGMLISCGDDGAVRLWRHTYVEAAE
jgi:WD40 repeat protein